MYVQPNTSRLKALYSHYLITRDVSGNTHPYWVISFDSVKISNSLVMMRGWARVCRYYGKVSSIQASYLRDTKKVYNIDIMEGRWIRRYHGKVSRCQRELLKRCEEGVGGNLLHPCRGESSRRVV